eukprot:GFUD01008789.1.p1 GENE.GFUD01008789.1~~GFUD01008789.1.p1  ORF type:complete len:259 (-),score=100.60 GFUD01008789.1:849-1565(-)
MENFDDDFGGPPADVDPAAEFLAKEQEELGEIGEDLGLAPPQEIAAFKEESDFSASGMQDFIPALSEDPGLQMQSEVPVSNYSGLEEFGGSTSPDYGGDFLSQDSGEIGMGMSNLNIAREEPEFLRQWKVDQEDRLKKKDEDEEVMKEKLRLHAQQELEDWYKRYETQLEKTKETNRDAESDFVEEVGGLNHIEPGSEWERVSKHCDFSAKAPGHTKDVSRMRSILLQLKQSPPPTTA